MDVFLLAALVVSFATLVAAHLSLSFGLAFRDPWWRGAVALVVPPFAPFFGFRERMFVRVALWAAGAVAWVLSSVVSTGG
ncbi:MAG TPA: hypothetical protein VHE30_23985 [Polyangiaceae bacterium]|nr:hypothetical protein [Polyangiaceae bacterium]